jgi:hypothetical protein
MNLVWEKSGDAFYSTVTDLAGVILWHLIVESDATGWDWAVWRPGEDTASARRGMAVTAHGAMWDAERAAY